MGSEQPRFSFERDTFAFVNETVWRYSVDPQTGRQIAETQEPVPEYTLRCFGLVRAAKLFFYHARFRPEQSKLEELEYAERVRRVMKRDPRVVRGSSERVEFPGFGSLREFSSVHEAMLKRELPGVWRSYLQRGNWRMVLPVSRRHQQHAADEICRTLQAGGLMGVHVYTFPELTINHALLAWAVEETRGRLTIRTYDPNKAQEPLDLGYDRDERTFRLPPTHYFKGGPIKAYNIYRSLFF